MSAQAKDHHFGGIGLAQLMADQADIASRARSRIDASEIADGGGAIFYVEELRVIAAERVAR